jgi:hypothetical protein
MHAAIEILANLGSFVSLQDIFGRFPVFVAAERWHAASIQALMLVGETLLTYDGLTPALNGDENALMAILSTCYEFPITWSNLLCVLWPVV